MRKGSLLLFLLAVFEAQPVWAAQPAATKPQPVPEGKPDLELSAIYEKATALEGKLELTRAEELYLEIVRRSDPDRQWTLWRNAQHGLRRVKAQRTEFTLTREELEKKLAATYRDYQPQEFDEWEKRGWILSRVVDGKQGYGIMNPTNLCFFDTRVMERNKSRAKGYREFAQIFLDESALLDRLRSESTVPRRSVAPMRFLLTYKVEIRQADLPPGKGRTGVVALSAVDARGAEHPHGFHFARRRDETLSGRRGGDWHRVPRIRSSAAGGCGDRDEGGFRLVRHGLRDRCGRDPALRQAGRVVPAVHPIGTTDCTDRAAVRVGPFDCRPGR